MKLIKLKCGCKINTCTCDPQRMWPPKTCKNCPLTKKFKGKNKITDIKMYLHCKTCLDVEKMTDKSILAVGLTDNEQIIILCETCGKVVGVFQIK